MFQFTAFNLSASEFEALNVIVDGVVLDLNDAPVEDMVLEYGDFAGFAPFGPENIMAEGGEGNDIITFGDFAAHQNSFVTVDGGGGDDTISFGGFAGHLGGTVIVDGGGGGDTISFGYLTSLNDGNVTVNGGAGDDIVSFGDLAGLNDGNVTVNSGAGDDVVSFGDDAGINNGNVTVNGGAGADTFIFGDGAENLSIDLGEGDGDIDSVTFDGEVFNTTIANWEYGVDVVSVVNKAVWIGFDDGTDTTFTNGPSETITFLDVTGVDLANFLF